jgi:transcriptional regulator with XRE-family HTH domain
MTRKIPNRRSAARAAPAVKKEPANDGANVAGSMGTAIRKRRLEAGLTLQDVARKAKFSISYLSQIERNILAPSVSTLKRIADILSIPAGLLMFAEGGPGPHSPVALVRRSERKQLFFPGSNIKYELLTGDMQRRASMLWVAAPPGSESGPAFSHNGEDGVVVIKGELEIEVGNVWHTLRKGDSIYFSAELSHRWRNRGKETVEAIWLSTPPSF